MPYFWGVKPKPMLMPFDAIRHFYKKFGFQQNLISEMVIGEKYAAVILNDGRLGVCATLGHVVEKTNPGFTPDLKNPTHRIVLNAFFNALLNDEFEHDGSDDIFTAVDFKAYQQIVMVGWFRSLHKKFKDARIPVKVFDMHNEHPEIEPMDELDPSVSQADALVVSSTTLFNGTLKEIIDKASPESDIFLLGPSTILHPDMFIHTPVKALFGSVFNPHDKAVLKIIRAGCGTPEFSGHMKKVFLRRPIA
jgi:hypothetical protein